MKTKQKTELQQLVGDVWFIKVVMVFSLVYMLSQTGLTAGAIVLLYGDSTTVSSVGNRTLAYMDSFEQSKTMQHLQQINLDYETFYRSQIITAVSSMHESTEFVKNLSRSFNLTEIQGEYKAVTATIDDFIAEIRHVLKSKKLSLDVPF